MQPLLKSNMKVTVKVKNIEKLYNSLIEAMYKIETGNIALRDKIKEILDTHFVLAQSGPPGRPQDMRATKDGAQINPDMNDFQFPEYHGG
jgi:hypothetical protein